ncbi:hypothetical protein [Ruania alba]|uniref:Uncharacterized protein n=1 Tax=Ruania alba TaxID=648782 RepID=A0A1H5M5S4_9MICO|nr:hypothetical protein [Ruania alba]SEE84011.1 hypothetical protein SAMN04488554_3138 [Ruania alba]
MTQPTRDQPVRPGGITAAVAMTILGSALMTVVGAGFVALGSVTPDQLSVLGTRAGTMVPFLGGALLVSAAAAITLAALVLRRRRGALYSLLALGLLVMFGCVLAVVYDVGGPQAIGPILWIGVASGLLWQHRTWFSD